MDKWAILGPKMVHPHNSVSALKKFFLIFHNEKGQQLDESNNGSYQKKCPGQMGHFRPENDTSCRSAVRIVLNFAQ